MPRRRLHGKRRAEELTTDQYWELLIGPRGADVSAFESTAEARAAWRTHREDMLSVCPAGQRPEGFWKYEARGKRQPGERDDVALIRLGLAGAADVAAFRARVYGEAISGRFSYFPAERPELERLIAFGAEYNALTPAEAADLAARLG